MDNCNLVKTGKPSGQIIKTSDVSIYDGIALSCISGTNLNELIASIDSKVCSVTDVKTSEVAYDGDVLLGSCDIPITPSFNPTTNDAFTSIANYICDLDTTINTRIDNLNTTNLTISSTTASNSSCFGTFTDATTLDVFLAALAQEVCDIPAPLPQEAVDLYDYESISRVKRTWTGVGGDSTHNSGSLEVDITGAGGETRYYVDGIKYKVSDTSAILLSSTSDNYLDYEASLGAYQVTAVSIGSPEPAVATGFIRVAKYETDGSGVVSYVDLREHRYQDGERWFDDSVITRHILDLNVTGAKLEDFGTAGLNDWSLASITLDNKGRVQSWTNNTTVTALADKDILQYNAGTGDWENVNLSSATIQIGLSQGETLYWETATSEWTNDGYLRNMPGAVGVGAYEVPILGLQIGRTVTQGYEMKVVSSFTATAGSSGSLTANTYYYTVTAIDDGGGETLNVLENSVSIDGIGQTSAIISWQEVPRASKYRVYKGVATGVYTEYFEVTADNLSYLDDATAGTAGSPPSSPDAFSAYIDSTGMTFGGTLVDSTIFSIKDLGFDVEQGIDILLSGGKAADTIGIKSVVDATNAADTNIGGWFSVLNGLNNYVLRVEDGVDNTGKFLKVIDAAGNVSFGNAGINVEDEGVSVLTDVNVIDFIGTGITASSPSAGRVEVTVTGGANSLNDLTDVTSSSANDWDTLAFDLGTGMWVTSGTLSNDLTNVAIGDKPGSIDARLHIHSTNGSDLLLIEDSVVGIICGIDTSGVLTYNERIKYTFNNGGAAPLGANKFLMSADALGNAEWATIPAFSIGFAGTIDYVTRWTSNTDLGIGVIRDDGSTVSIGVAPNSSSQVDVESGRLNTLRLEQTGSLPNSTIIDASTSFTGALSGNTKLVNILAGGSSHTGVMQGISSTVGTDGTTHNTGVIGVANNGINQNVGIDGSASGSQTIDVGVRGGANTGSSLATISSSFSSIGMLSTVGFNTNSLKHTALFYGETVASHANDNYGLILDLDNSGAGTQYIGIFNDNRTAGAGKFLKSIDGNGTAEWDDIPPPLITGISGITDYVARWTPSGTELGTGIIRDDGSTVGINTAPNATIQTYLLSALKEGFVSNNNSTISSAAAIHGNAYGTGVANFGVKGSASGGTDGNVAVSGVVTSGHSYFAGHDIGVYGQSSSATTNNIGGRFVASAASTGENIGVWAKSGNGATNYAIRIEDSTVGVGKVLTDSDGAGRAIWSTMSLSSLADPYVYEQTTVSTATHSTGTEHTIFADTSSNDVTINLPAAASNAGRVFTVKKIDSANKVVLDGNLAETIDGSTTHEMFGLYDWVKVQCDGSNWFIIA